MESARVLHFCHDLLFNFHVIRSGFINHIMISGNGSHIWHGEIKIKLFFMLESIKLFTQIPIKSKLKNASFPRTNNSTSILCFQGCRKDKPHALNGCTKISFQCMKLAKSIWKFTLMIQTRKVDRGDDNHLKRKILQSSQCLKPDQILCPKHVSNAYMHSYKLIY